MADILNEKYITFSRKFFPVPQDMTQMHAHMNHEIYFLVSGARRYFIKDAVYDVSANDVVIIPHWELHRTVTNFPLECERCLIYFPDIYTADIRREIGNAAFENCTALTAISVPNSVKSIGLLAFDGCSALASATLTAGTTEIGNFAFNGCAKNLVISCPAGSAAAAYANEAGIATK